MSTRVHYSRRAAPCNTFLPRIGAQENKLEILSSGATGCADHLPTIVHMVIDMAPGCSCPPRSAHGASFDFTLERTLPTGTAMRTCPHGTFAPDPPYRDVRMPFRTSEDAVDAIPSETDEHFRVKPTNILFISLNPATARIPAPPPSALNGVADILCIGARQTSAASRTMHRAEFKRQCRLAVHSSKS